LSSVGPGDLGLTLDKFISFAYMTATAADKVLCFLAVVTDLAAAGWADGCLSFGLFSQLDASFSFLVW